VLLRISGEIPPFEPVKEFMADMFGDPEIKEEHNNMLQYQLKSNIKLSYIFGQLEAVRTHLSIEDYSVSQTTLDQVCKIIFYDKVVNETRLDLQNRGLWFSPGSPIKLTIKI
jgi:hypothetical protein